MQDSFYKLIVVFFNLIYPKYSTPLPYYYKKKREGWRAGPRLVLPILGKAMLEREKNREGLTDQSSHGCTIDQQGPCQGPPSLRISLTGLRWHRKSSWRPPEQQLSVVAMGAAARLRLLRHICTTVLWRRQKRRSLFSCALLRKPLERGRLSNVIGTARLSKTVKPGY